MGLFDEELAQLTKKPEEQATPAAPAVPATEATPAPQAGGGMFGVDVDLPYEGPTGRINKMNPELWDKFTQMALDYREATGEKLRFTDTARTFAEQVDLKRRKPTLAATPGKSRHEIRDGYANAIDIDETQVPKVEQLGLLETHGFIRPALYKGETWHIEQGGALSKARAFANKIGRQFPMGPAEALAGPLEMPAAPPLPTPVSEKPVEPASWKEIQDPFASSVALVAQHPEESVDPFVAGFKEGAGWGFLPATGEHQRSALIVPTNMYTFGHDVGMMLPIMLSLGIAAPAATAVGAMGMGTGLSAEILTPFARSILGGAFYGGGKKTNELVADSITGKPTPSTIQGWGQILGSAYNDALGFALAHAGINATFGELASYMGLRNFKKAFKDPIIEAAGGEEQLKVAAAKDPSLRELKERSPGISKTVTDLNSAAQRRLDEEIGTVLDQYGRPVTEATRALEKPSFQRNAIEKFQADQLEKERLEAFRAGEPSPTGEVIPAPAERGGVVSTLTKGAQREIYGRETPTTEPTPAPTIAEPKIVQPAPSGEVVPAPAARVATAEVMGESLDKTLLEVAEETPGSVTPEVDVANALGDRLGINQVEAEELVAAKIKDGSLRLREDPDGFKLVAGPRLKPAAIEMKPTEIPEGLAPKSIAEPDGTTWNQSGVYIAPGGGLRHEFYVVSDPQVDGGMRFVEKIYKGDKLLKTATNATGDAADISRHMQNSMSMAWQNAHKFTLGATDVGGTLMYSGIPVDQFIPTLKRLAPARQFEMMRGLWKELHMAFSPESISAEGQLSAQAIREYHARIRQGINQREAALEIYRREFANMTPEGRQAFIDGPLCNYENTGVFDPTYQPRTVGPEYKPFLQAYKEACDRMIAAIEETTGKAFPYKEFYFRHMWDDSPQVIRAAVDLYNAQAANGYYDRAEIREMVESIRSGQPIPSPEAIKAYAGKRSLEGPKSFLKQQTIPTMAEGMSWGLKAFSDNPVDIALVDLMQKHRYLLGQRVFKQLKEQGLVKYDQTADIPPDWVPIEDKIAQVWHYVNRPAGDMIPVEEERPMGGGPERAGYWEEPAVKGFMAGGKYYAPPEVAAIVNRDLAAGLRGSQIYRMYRTPTDMLNSIAVAWSGFHWFFESISAQAIGSGRGITDTWASIAKGDWKGAAKGISDILLNQPLALPLKLLRDVPLGSKLKAEINRPDFAGIGDATGLDARTTTLADFAMRAGGSAGGYKSLYDSMGESLGNALKDIIGRHPLKAAKDITELVSKPLMEWYVPRIKLATFARLLDGDLEGAAAKMGRALTDSEQSLVAMNTWQHIDNIFGQLVYDNLHLKKAFRDGLFMFVRFPGWNIGSLRSLTGTGRGIVKLATGQEVDYQAKVAMEYAMGLGLNLAVWGTLTNYALAGEFPKTFQDIYMPRTGRLLPDGTPERVWFPSYLRDYMGFVQEPIKEVLKGNTLGVAGKIMNTVSAKMAPGIRLAYEIITNKNYFGEQVFTPGTGALNQAGEFVEHIGSEYLVPFGPQQAMKARGPASAVANIAGITSVPRRYLRSPAQEVISEYNALKRGVQTKSEAEKSQYRQDILDALRTGDIEQAKSVFKEATEALRFGPGDAKDLMKEARTNPLVHGFKGLSLEYALKAYRVASDQERALLGPAMSSKFRGASMVDKLRLKNEIQAVFQDVQAKKQAPRRVAWD